MRCGAAGIIGGMTTASAASFRRVIAAEVVSNFGSMMSRLAIPWLAVLMLGATPWQMGLLAVADVLAAAVAALALGVAIDRRPKRAVMVAADIARTALLGLLALAAAGGSMSFVALLGAAAAGGVLGMAFELARSAWIAQAAPADELSRRNAQLAAGGAISEAAAFAITGAVFQWIGGIAVLAVDALSYLVSAALLRRVDEPAHAVAADGVVAAEAGEPVSPRATTSLSEALRLLLRHTSLRTLAMLDGLVALAMGVASSCYMIFVSRELALSTAVLGVVFALGGAGSALGAAVAPRTGRRIGSGQALAWGLVAAAIGSAFIPLASGAGLAAIGLLAAHQLIGDAGLVSHHIHDRTMRQTLVPADALARVDGAMRTLDQAAVVAGALGGGAFATAYGARPGMWLSTALLGVAALVALASFRRTPAAASRSIA